MNILLTGYKGFIGGHMLTALESAGHYVSTFEWGEGNMPSVIEQDWVMHIGAISSTTDRNIDKVLRQNFDFSCQLFDVCKTFGINFQYSSSASVYGLTSSFKEDALVDPRTPYAWSKYLFERYVRNHIGGNIVQGFRYFNVYGPNGEEHKGDQASPYFKFTKQAKETGVIKIFKNSENYKRDFIQVQDVIRTHLDFLNINKSGIWNLGTGQSTSFESVARIVADQYNARIEYIEMPEILKDSYQTYTCADMQQLNATRLTKLS